MQLIEILLTAVSILTLLSGFSVFMGANKSERSRALLFFLATIGAALWSVSITLFLQLSADSSPELTELTIFGIYIPAILMDVALLGYMGWRYKLGRVLLVFFGLTGTFLACALVSNPEILYSSTSIGGPQGNAIAIEDGWYYYAYMSWFIAATAALLGFCFHQARHQSTKGARTGYWYFLVSFAITGGLSLIFDILLPRVRYDLIWIGPLTIGATILGFYYAILRYRIMPLATRWLKVLSYVIIMAAAAIIYMLIFFLIFTALFKIPNPSTAVIALNFIMIVIVLLLLPVINELNAFVRSLISVGQVDIAYIVKKLNKIAPGVNLEDLASFLSDHLHFAYIGFVINGRLYGSGALKVSADELRQIQVLAEGERGVWQELPPELQSALSHLRIKAVAELRNARGKVFGQMLVGEPWGKMAFERRDLIQLEMIVNLVAAVIDSEKHTRA